MGAGVHIERDEARGERRRAVLAIVAVTAVAAALRLFNLGFPAERIFDEFYYAKSACIFLGGSMERCGATSDDERFWYEDKRDTGAWVHPPLGKWAIAIGEAAFGTDDSDGLDARDALGFRVASAVAGTITVLAFAILLQVLFGSVLWTTIGGLLLATEGLSIVQSRVAMLDVFVSMWILLAFLAIVWDRRWIERRSTSGPDGPDYGGGEVFLPRGEEPAAEPETPSPLWRPYRFLAGLLLGLALATKWSALLAIAAIGLLALLWEFARRRRAGMPRWFAWTILREGFGIILALVALPLVVYVASYADWFLRGTGSFSDWLALQDAILGYHRSLTWMDPVTMAPVHAYLSEAWRWMLLTRPVLYWAKYLDDGSRAVIYAQGNPVIFWTGIVAVPFAVWTWLRQRDWRAGLASVGFLGMYLPWFLVDRPQFLFYALPLVPFIVLSIVIMLRYLRREGAGVVANLIVGAALFASAWFWPILVGMTISDAQWKLRAWFPSWI